MDSELIAALSADAPMVVHLLTIELPDHSIRWTDGGFVVWDGETYQEEDATFGRLGSCEEIEDGVTGDATIWSFTALPPYKALGDWTAPEVQGSTVTLHLASVSFSTGLLIGEPELLIRCELDEPRLGTGRALTLTYECITEEARMLEPNEERRLSDAFHKSVWPGEKGYEQTAGTTRTIYWRQDTPSGGSV